MKKMDNIKYELFDAFVGEDWFYDIRINESLDERHKVELIVNENFNISALEDVKDELRFHGFRIYGDNYIIAKRSVKDTYSVKFAVYEIVYR